MNLQPKHLKNFWTKKNILFVSLVLIFAIGLGVTTAWLSGNDGPTNYVFEGAFVDCAVEEQFDGTTKSNVCIENTGNVDAYIRATYTVSWVKDGTGVNNVVPVVYHTAPQEGTDYAITYGSGWSMSTDGYVYYNSAVSPEEFTTNVINSLTDKGTAPAGYHLQVTVLPEAVQAEGANAFGATWGTTQNLAQVRPAANVENKTLETMVLTMNIRNSGDQLGDGTFAGDQEGGEWTRRRGSMAQYFRGSERDIICLQDVSYYQSQWLEQNVNTSESRLTYGFAYWSFRASETWYRGLLTMYDKNRYQYLDYECVPFSESGSEDDLTYVDNSLEANNQPYHYRGALITRFKEISTGVIIAVCNVQADYPADGTVGQHTSTQLAKIDQLREMGVRRALTRLYAQDADFYLMAGDFTADAYRNPTWYNAVLSKMKDVLPGETTKTLNHWDERYTRVYQRECPLPGEVNGPVDFIFVDKNTDVYYQEMGGDGQMRNHTIVHVTHFNSNQWDLYSHHYAVYTKVKFKNH